MSSISPRGPLRNKQSIDPSIIKTQGVNKQKLIYILSMLNSIGDWFKKGRKKLTGAFHRVFTKKISFEKCVPIVTPQVDEKQLKWNEAQRNLKNDENALNYTRLFKLREYIPNILSQAESINGAIKDTATEWQNLNSYLENESFQWHPSLTSQQVEDKIRIFFDKMQHFYTQAANVARALPKNDEKRKEFASFATRFVGDMKKMKGVLKFPSTDPYLQTLEANCKNSLEQLRLLIE